MVIILWPWKPLKFWCWKTRVFGVFFPVWMDKACLLLLLSWTGVHGDLSVDVVHCRHQEAQRTDRAVRQSNWPVCCHHCRKESWWVLSRSTFVSRRWICRVVFFYVNMHKEMEQLVNWVMKCWQNGRKICPDLYTIWKNI